MLLPVYCYECYCAIVSVVLLCYCFPRETIWSRSPVYCYDFCKCRLLLRSLLLSRPGALLDFKLVSLTAWRFPAPCCPRTNHSLNKRVRGQCRLGHATVTPSTPSLRAHRRKSPSRHRSRHHRMGALRQHRMGRHWSRHHRRSCPGRRSPPHWARSSQRFLLR